MTMDERRQPSPFASYQEAIDWLYSTQQFGIKLGLENVSQLLAALELSEPEARIIHVAGTNGKGSVCAMADSLLRASGLRVGLFTSPHLVHYSERMRINGTAIPEAEVATRLSKLSALVADWENHPTFFELTLALALDWFHDDGVEAIVLETGMGGRLDATNALTANVSLITPIALDHQKWLGDSLAKIASEKAGIFKPGVPAFSAYQAPEAVDALESAAKLKGTPLTFIGVSHVSELDGISLALDGLHQRSNAALALAAVQAIEINPDIATIRHAMGSVRWPARFQRFLGDRIVVDGAHNVQAATALAATWRETFGDAKAQLIFGGVEDKDHHAILQELALIAASICYVPFASARAISPRQMLSDHHPNPDIPASEGTSLRSVLMEACDQQADARYLVAGSLFLAGEALSILQDSDFESSLQ